MPPSVLDFITGDVFSFRVVMTQPAIRPVFWSNTWEAVATDTGDESALIGLGTALADFHKALFNGNFSIDRVVISTWVPDGQPYNPSTFTVLTVGAPGTMTRSGGVVQLPINECLHVRRVVPSGRNGILLLRGYLDTSNTTDSAGIATLTSLSATQTAIDTAVTGAGLDDYLTGGASPNLKLATVASHDAFHLPEDVRQIQALTVAGITSKKLNNRFFNRTPPSP